MTERHVTPEMADRIRAAMSDELRKREPPLDELTAAGSWRGDQERLDAIEGQLFKILAAINGRLDELELRLREVEGLIKTPASGGSRRQ